MKKILAAALLFGLSGCENTANKEKFYKDIANCVINYPKVVGNYYNNAMCIDDAEMNYTSGSSIDFYEAQNRALARDFVARQVDAGNTTPEQAVLSSTRAITQAQRQAVEEDAERRSRAAAIMLQSGALRLQPIY